jgi:hypothetical protein
LQRRASIRSLSNRRASFGMNRRLEMMRNNPTLSSLLVGRDL